MDELLEACSVVELRLREWLAWSLRLVRGRTGPPGLGPCLCPGLQSPDPKASSQGSP